MILVGIDVAKDKHDCFIQTLEGKVLYNSFSFANNYDGFEELVSCNDTQIKVGLEKPTKLTQELSLLCLSLNPPTTLILCTLIKTRN